MSKEAPSTAEERAVKAEWIRKYRAEGRDVSTMARNKAKNMTVQWVRSNHPEVWALFMEQAREKVWSEQDERANQ